MQVSFPRDFPGFLRRLRQQQLQPDVMTYSACVSACEAAGRWLRAVSLLAEMRRAAVAAIPCFFVKLGGGDMVKPHANVQQF